MLRVLLAAMILGWAMPGEAGVIYRFALGAGAAPGITQAEGSLHLTEAARRDGLRIAANQFDTPPDWTALGLLDLSLTVNGQHVGLGDLAPARLPWSMLRWSLDLRATPGGAPTGALSFSTGEWSMAWRLDGGASGGRFETDNPGISRGCTITGACSFAGSFAAVLPAVAPPARAAGIAPVVVPEPMALALYGLGLAGIAVLGRRRGRAG